MLTASNSPHVCYRKRVRHLFFCERTKGVRGVVDANDGKAAVHFAVAAERGFPSAQYNLAFQLEQGVGVEKDSARALELWERKVFTYNVLHNGGLIRSLDSIPIPIPIPIPAYTRLSIPAPELHFILFLLTD